MGMQALAVALSPGLSTEGAGEMTHLQVFLKETICKLRKLLPQDQTSNLVYILRLAVICS